MDVAESQIETPQNGMFVVLQQGGNKAGWSSNGYLNPSGSFKAAVDAVYQLEIDTTYIYNQPLVQP